MSSTMGNKLKIDIFGESHGKAVGVLINGLPAGEELDENELRFFMHRRAGGKSFSTSRKEADEPIFLSGVLNGKTTGSPLCAIIENKNFKKSDYEALSFTPRPSHADYPAFVKYNGFCDLSGGGHFSGRLTAPLCIAGGICKQILKRKNIEVAAHIYSISNINDVPFDMCNPEFSDICKKDFPVIDDEKGKLMQDEILKAKNDLDSVGGIVECAVTGLKAGLGEPMFNSLESRISANIFGIGAVRGIEFGLGFDATKIRGSIHNDSYYIEENEIKTKTNNHGGILGGLTTSMPIIFRVAFKPTPSIGIEQDSVDLIKMQNTKIKISGRHDPCIVPRAVPCVEAAAAVTILDLILENNI